MKAMTVKDFDSLQQRDFENGAVRVSIRIALKERESAQQETTVTKEWVENLVSDLNASYIGCSGSKPGYRVVGDALHSLGVVVKKER